jgi:hypothetical protein
MRQRLPRRSLKRPLIQRSPSSLLFYIPTDDILRTSFQLDPPAADSYRSVAGDGLFRVSLGLEHPDDLIRDLDQALA